MLGELIAQLDRPHVAEEVLAVVDPPVHEALERAACHASMSTPDFVAGAVREFVERADDELWFQLLTYVRTSEPPGLKAVRTILTWVVTKKRQPGRSGLQCCGRR